MPTEVIHFENFEGHQLAARLERPPAGKPKAYALFAHCFTCGKNNKAAVRIARALAERGIAVLRFDFTGIGESEGDFPETNFSSNVADIVAAADYMRLHWQPPRLLIGHSFGGAAVIQAAEDVPEALAVCTIGAPAEAAHVRHLLEDAEPAIRERGEAKVTLAGRTFTVKQQFLDNLDASAMQQRLGDSDKALLIFHAPGDKVVAIENAEELFDRAPYPKSLIALDNADHLLSNADDCRYVADLVASWSRRYVPELAETAGASHDGRVVASIGRDHYPTAIRAGGHRFVSDEPDSLGGSDSGPTPYDLLLGALGACTAITLRMYADRKKWPLEQVDVLLDQAKIHAEDCDDCENKDDMIHRINRQLVLAGDLDQEQRERLHQIADRCPVHKTLHGKIDIRTTLAP